MTAREDNHPMKPYVLRRERLHLYCESCARTWIIRDRATGQRLGTTFRSLRIWYGTVDGRVGHLARHTRAEAAASVWDRTRP